MHLCIFKNVFVSVPFNQCVSQTCFQELLTRHKIVCAEFLEKNYDRVSWLMIFLWQKTTLRAVQMWYKLSALYIHVSQLTPE